jgi:hypothetical protein
VGECRDPAALEGDYPRAERGTGTGNSAQNPRGSRPEILQTTESSAGQKQSTPQSDSEIACQTLSYGSRKLVLTEKNSVCFLIKNFSLKVPKREIFDRSDFPDLYTIKPLRMGDFGVKIKNLLKNI